MLTVTDVNADAAGEITVDTYVPFTFRATPWPRDEVITWYHRDRASNMLEFKIDKATGDLYEVTLVSSDRPIQDARDLPCHLLPTTQGLPIVASGAVDGKTIEQRMDFSILRANRDFCVVWDGWNRTTECMGLDRVSFLLAETSIVGVCFLGLTDGELATVEEWDRFRDPKNHT